MAELSPENKQKLLVDTGDAAAALLEDLASIRSLVDRAEIRPDEIRRMSAILRRLLVEGDLRNIASPRVGRIEVVVPDLKVPHQKIDNNNFVFFSCGHVSLFGMYIAALTLNKGREPLLQDYDVDAQTSLNLEKFQAQRVMFFDGTWVTRADVIKYVANVAQGVHTGTAKTRNEILIGRMRCRAYVSNINDLPKVTFDVILPHEPDVKIDRTFVDCVLIELLATAKCLVASADVQKLEAEIVKEMSV